MALLAFDGVVITLAGSRLRMKNLGHNFGQVRRLVYFLFCDAREINLICTLKRARHVLSSGFSSWGRLYQARLA
jgi:hypothetical protein